MVTATVAHDPDRTNDPGQLEASDVARDTISRRIHAFHHRLLSNSTQDDQRPRPDLDRRGDSGPATKPMSVDQQDTQTPERKPDKLACRQFEVDSRRGQE